MEKRWRTIADLLQVHLVDRIMAGFLPYCDILSSDASKRRYSDKLKLVDGIDPYEIKKNVWQDDVVLWPAITHVHVCMYLILTPSPYSEKDYYY